MIVNNQKKLGLIKQNKNKSSKIININKNNKKKENIYFQNILKANSVKNVEKINPQIKNINENIHNIFSSDESKKKALKYILKHHQKKNNNDNNTINNQKKTNTLINSPTSEEILTESEKNEIIYKDSLKNLNNNIKVLKSKKDCFDTNLTEYNLINKKPVSTSNELNINKSDNNLKTNINYKNLDFKNMYYSNNQTRNLYKKNHTIDADDIHKYDNNNNRNTTENIFKRSRPLYSKKKIPNLDKNRKNKTPNSFYRLKKPLTYSINTYRDLTNIDNISNNGLSDTNETYSIYYSQTIDNCDNNRKNVKNNNRKKKNNKIRIINKGKIKQFDINIEDINFTDRNLNYKRNPSYMTITHEYIKKNQLEDNNKYYYMKNIPPININQFNINTNNNNSLQNFTENNYFNDIKNTYYSNFYEDKFFTEKHIYNKRVNRNNSRNENNTHILIKNNNLTNTTDSLSKISIPKIHNTNQKIILVKKRPLNELKIKNISYKKFQKLKYINNNGNNIQTVNYNTNNEPKKFIYNLFQSKVMSFVIDSTSHMNKDNKNNHITKNNNNEKNVIIIKKNEGNIFKEFKFKLNESLEKINQELIKGYFKINNQAVKFVPLNYNNNIINKQNLLLKENKKLKNANILLDKKDKMKNDLIKKLDKEKLNLIEEIQRLVKEIKDKNTLYEKLLNENEKIKQENTKINNCLNELTKNDNKEEEERIFQIGNIDIESINEGQL